MEGEETMSIMLTEHFDLRELVHPGIYNKVGDRCADFLNPNLAPTLELIKVNFSEFITVNNWHIGGKFESSGLRDWHDPVGAGYSPHYYGTAADCKFRLHTPTQIYHMILNNQGIYPYIVRMESAEHTVTWLHIEVSSKPRVGDIIIFNP